MSDAPDPLGKRALFWAPAEREEVGRPARNEPAVTGKHALFSAATDPDAPATTPAASRARSSRAPRAAAGPGGIVPPVSLHCAACGTQSEVDVVGYLALHFPFFLWRPGKGFTRFMTCPACHRRAWLSASWTPWSGR